MRRPVVSRAAALSAAAVLFSVSVPRAQMPVAPPAPGASMAAVGAEAQEPEFLNLRVAGHDVYRGVRKVLTELTWHRDLDLAASQAKKQQRPILWLQMLGDLRGFS